MKSYPFIRIVKLNRDSFLLNERKKRRINSVVIGGKDCYFKNKNKKIHLQHVDRLLGLSEKKRKSTVNKSNKIGMLHFGNTIFNVLSLIPPINGKCYFYQLF